MERNMVKHISDEERAELSRRLTKHHSFTADFTFSRTFLISLGHLCLGVYDGGINLALNMFLSEFARRVKKANEMRRCFVLPFARML
jgi:hypothetical protein